MSYEHICWVDHAAFTHTGNTEYRCRCHKVLVTLDSEGNTLTHVRGYEEYAHRLRNAEREGS